VLVAEFLNLNQETTRMTIQNQAFDAAETATEEVVKTDPTLASIRGEREEAAAERAHIQAEREEARRVATKRSLLGEVLNMQADIEKRYDEVKAQKKKLKELRKELEAVDADSDLTADDLQALLKKGYEAYFNQPVPASPFDGGILKDVIIDVVKSRNPLLDGLKFRPSEFIRR